MTPSLLHHGHSPLASLLPDVFPELGDLAVCVVHYTGLCFTLSVYLSSALPAKGAADHTIASWLSFTFRACLHRSMCLSVDYLSCLCAVPTCLRGPLWNAC